MNTPNRPQITCTVYFDGACPLCSKEIAHYQQCRGAETIDWVDVSQCEESELGPQLQRSQALAQLHARDTNGNLVFGAAAFVMLWQQLPALRWLSVYLKQPWMLWVLNRLYQVFLILRPLWRKKIN
jgi:predicted DCC family thiol-disulfide oxidoreductase YuxK